MTKDFKLPQTFGRMEELEAIENALIDSSRSGILIEGEMGMGKTLLARTIYHRRGSRDQWIRADRVLQTAEFGAFGLVVDLDRQPESLVARIVKALTEREQTPVVFVDDAHFLDERSVGILAQLAYDGEIRMVATTRQERENHPLPFIDLVEDRVLDRIALDVLGADDYSEMMEHLLGGIVSRGVIDIVDFHSGRNPGKMLELLSYTNRQHRLLDRQGVWLLDGLDIDYDERARDVARIDLSNYSQAERDALELVVLAGEIEVELMLEAGLGPAADALVSAGDLRIVDRGARLYSAVENHASETIRYTIPVGRSRQKFELVSGYRDSPSERARLLRADWGLGCGAVMSEQDIIDNSRAATRSGDWLRALRLISEIPTDRLAAHELFDLGRLYCDSNQVPIGLDVLAQCVEKACCPRLVLEGLVIWLHRDFDRTSPALHLDDFLVALDRLETEPPRHPQEGLDCARARSLVGQLDGFFSFTLPFDEETARDWVFDDTLPETVRVLITVVYTSLKSDLGRSEEAFEVLDQALKIYRSVGIGSLLLTMLRVKALLQQGHLDQAKDSLLELPTNDIAYLAARSGPSDLLWTQAYSMEGQFSEATRSIHAAVEGLDYWNHTAYMAIALATAEYMAMLDGNVEVADDYRSRSEALSPAGPYIDFKRALVLRTVARWMRTGDERFRSELHELLRSAQAEGSHGLEAFIRLHLFRHFGEADASELCRLAPLGTDFEFGLLEVLGPALRDKDSTALSEFAEARASSMPDLAERCRALAHEFGTGRRNGDGHEQPISAGGELTERERQISRLIIAGRTNAEIAAELGVAVRTVEGHTYRLFRKLEITKRSQVLRALERLAPNG